MTTIRTSSRAIICRGGRYLVVRYRNDIGDWFVFPGGGQQCGEDLHEALAREVREEVGAQVTIGRLRFVRDCIAARLLAGNLAVGSHQLEVFFDRTLTDEPTQQPEVPDPGQTGFEWLSVEDLKSRRFFPQALLESLSESDAKYLGAC